VIRPPRCAPDVDADGALGGLRVVELGSGIATAFAARLLGDLGADVVKLEPPEGDPLRGAEPRLADGTSLLFELCNWGKRSVVADAAELVAGADAVIATPEALPAPPAELVARSPALTVTTVSGFGMTGPLRDWQATDLVLQATGGIMRISGTTDREPLKHGLRNTLWCGGLNAAYATLAAHLGGGGRHVDLSLQECVASQLVLNEAHYAFMGAVQGRRPPAQDPLAGDPLPTADGWVSLQTSGLIAAERLAELFGDARLADPRFTSSESRTRHAAELQAILAEHLSTESGRDFFLRASRAGFLAGVVQTPADLLACPQLAERGMWQELEGLPGIRFPARWASLSATPVRVRGRAPRLGAHTAEVLAAPRAAREAAPPAGDGPLAGVRVVDLSTVFAVPYLGALLADLGAEVIKVEPPHRLDQTRAIFGHPFFDNDPAGDWWDRSGIFQVVNRGKRSLTLDLSQEPGRDVLRALLAQSDVLLDNFTPRVLRGWGMTPDVLHALNPRLVTLSNTGYGSTGSWAAFRAQGTSLEATMGASHLTGYPDGKPSKAGQSWPDFVACWAGLVAVLAALAHRRRTGEGQHIDLGMYQLGVIVMPEALLHLQAHGEDLGRRGNEDLGVPASGLVAAAGEDRWLAVSAPSRAAVAAAIGADPGEDVMGALAAWARDRDAAQAAAALQEAGVAAGPVLDARELLTDEHLRARGFYEEADCGPGCGTRPVIGRPYRMRGAAVRGPGPRFGEANEDILRGLLGLDAARIAELRDLGVVADAPTGVPTALTPIDLDVLLASRSVTSIDADYVDVLASSA
jgi:crotonobetainyl-CoA:carnitine CoA-transferase CaiB-like acyl-CoA transferase